MVIETKTLAHIVIEKAEEIDDDSHEGVAPFRADVHRSNAVNAISGVQPEPQMSVGKLWRWAKEPERRSLVAASIVSALAVALLCYYSFMGQFDNAISEIRRAQELDPVSLVKLTGLAQVLLMARRYDEALEQCRKAVEMDPNLGIAHWLLGLSLMYKGSYEPAILALQKSIPLSGDSPDERATLAHAYALSGRRTEARKILEELKQQAKRKFISPGAIADLYGALGDKDQAFALLDKAVEERDNMVILLKVEPTFDPLRSDPRFASLLRRVGFQE